ncbi:hypothetical protein ACQ4PT_026701 [Festuca glaucescens]
MGCHAAAYDTTLLFFAPQPMASQNGVSRSSLRRHTMRNLFGLFLCKLPRLLTTPSLPNGVATAAAAAHSVFVYGTLMSEEVVRVLLGRVPPSSPALLPNHQRFSIRGRVYPAILPVDGNEVSGREWKKVYLKDYLTMTQDFKEELEQLEPKTDD